MKTYTLAEIKALCEAYDQWHGEFPEHMWEGASFYKWIAAHSVESPTPA